MDDGKIAVGSRITLRDPRDDAILAILNGTRCDVRVSFEINVSSRGYLPGGQAP